MNNPQRPKDHGEVASIYRDAVHYDLLAQMTAPNDLPFYRRLVERFPGPVLEMGCGTGRISLPLADQGVSVTGFDNSAAMLTYARAKMRVAGLTPAFHCADMRDFAVGGDFALVIIPYNGFNHLLTNDDVKRCLACVNKHLRKDGRLVIDTFNPDPGALHLTKSEPKKILHYRHPESLEEIELFEENHYEAATQVNTVTWSYRGNGGEQRRQDVLKMRQFFPEEFNGLLELGGFAVIEKYGGYQDEPFGSITPKQLAVCRKLGSLDNKPEPF